MSKARSGRPLIIAIIALLVLGIGLLVWAATQLQTRRSSLGELALIRTQQMLHVRLDGLFSEMAEDMREEAAAFSESDSTLAMERWYPLLLSHWPILSIRLANEHGDEVALIREDSTYLLRYTMGGSKDGPPILVRFAGQGPPQTMVGPLIDTADYDPRERVWFSKALEDSRDEPSWTLRMSDEGETPLLQSSYLIRSERTDEPYHILVFTMDLSRSSWMDTQTATLPRAGILLLDDEGRSLGRVAGDANSPVARATEMAASKWREKKTSIPFLISVDDKQFRCQFGTYPLNGQQINTGVVIDLAPVNAWIAPERMAVAAAGTFLLLLIVLLTWAWISMRSVDDRLRKQTRRTRAQEVKLAKALGERDVLNREVHHRVKNNLQVVSSLLNLQATRLDDGPVKNEFLRGKRRIDTIALVHHKLYGLVDLRNVDLFRFFSDLVKALAEMHKPQSASVSCEVDTDHTKADQDTAIELGVILCELVANSFQHAFPYVTGGHVEIRVRPVEGDLHRLTVKDNGKGITEEAREGAGKLGLEIVEALSEQLDGSFHVQTNGGGVLFEVLFRMKRTVEKAINAEADMQDPGED